MDTKTTEGRERSAEPKPGVSVLPGKPSETFVRPRHTRDGQREPVRVLGFTHRGAMQRLAAERSKGSTCVPEYSGTCLKPLAQQLLDEFTKLAVLPK